MFASVIKNRMINCIPRAILFCLLVLAIIYSPAFSSDEKENTYPDEAGREAMRLWSEKERDREMSEAVRRYWDYWSFRQPGQYSAHRLWYELEQTQRWLKDPDNNPPPPPPPMPPGHFRPYPYQPYPYMYYPPPWSYGPWYPPSYSYPYPYERRRHRR